MPYLHLPRLTEGAGIYCRTSVQMIGKHYAAHLKDTLDAAAINRRRQPVRRRKRLVPTASDDGGTISVGKDGP